MAEPIPLFLSKVYLDIHRYDQRQTDIEGLSLLALSNEKLLHADVYNILGDSYYKSLKFDKAREMYGNSRKSFDLVQRIVNYNAMKGLQGL